MINHNSQGINPLSMKKLLSILVLALLVLPLAFAQDITVEVKKVSDFQLAMLSIVADKPSAEPGTDVKLTLGIALDIPSGKKIANADVIVYKGSTVYQTKNILSQVSDSLGGKITGPIGANLQLKTTIKAPAVTGDYLVAYRIIGADGKSLVTESQQFQVSYLGALDCPKQTTSQWNVIGNPTLGQGTWESKTTTIFNPSGGICKQDSKTEYRTVCTSPESKTMSGKFAECDVVKIETPKQNEQTTESKPTPTTTQTENKNPLSGLTTTDYATVAGLTIAGVLIGMSTPITLPIGAILGFAIGVGTVILI